LNYEIRAAKHEDLPGILAELKEFAKFYNSKTSLFGDEDHAKKFISKVIDDHFFIVAVSPDDNGILGFISGMIFPHIYNPAIMTLVESFWWVKPDFRTGKIGKHLLDEFVEYGKANADWIITTLEDESPVNDSVFLNRGFKNKERNFILEVN